MVIINFEKKSIKNIVIHVTYINNHVKTWHMMNISTI